MQRFTGDYQGQCSVCDQPVEFALGIQTGRDPVGMHFGPGGAVPVVLRDVDLVVMIGDELDVKFRYDCPLCAAENDARTICRAVPFVR
ncbi:MAG: hypothetical protein KF841_14900 [Phycisphaerae bacterium]|nr:hypothetical protein [Phycisphaerae bacterium]